MSAVAYWVIVEWDGMKPNNAFYHRLKLLSSGVQKGTAGSAPPIARRSARNKNAIIVQESAVYCADEQLARSIALLAQQYGAKDVLMSQVTETKPVEADEQDLQALARIEQIAGARGHRSVNIYSEDKEWTVFCYNEMAIHKVKPGLKPINCPECGSFMCGVYPDVIVPDKIAWYPHNTILSSWLALRFRSTKIFFPIQNITRTMQPDNEPWNYSAMPRYDSYSGYGARKIIQNCTGFEFDENEDKGHAALLKIATSDLSFLDAFVADIPTAIKILDGLYVSQVYIRPERRQNERITAIVRALSDHRDVMISQLAEREDKLDIFDAAAHVNHVTLSNAFTDIDDYYLDKNIEPTFYQRNVAGF